MTMKSRTPRVAALIAIALVNLFGLMSSGHLEQIRTVDTLRLLLSGLLIGLAIGQLRLHRAAAGRATSLPQ